MLRAFIRCRDTIDGLTPCVLWRPGLSKEKDKKTVTWKGPKGQTKKSTVVPGQALKDIARGTGVPIKYDCQEGTCKTCEAKIGNQKVKICVAKMVRASPCFKSPCVRVPI